MSETIFQKRMRTLIYKRTHSGDPDPKTGIFGIKKCMGRVRGWPFDAVIGVGGNGQEAKQNRIDRKLTWIGIEPNKTGNPLHPLVSFQHFLYYGEQGPLLEKLAPKLADHMFARKARFILDSLTDDEREEVQKILDLAKKAPPSGQSQLIPFRNRT